MSIEFDLAWSRILLCQKTMYILQSWVMAAVLLAIGCVSGKINQYCGICNRGGNIAIAAGAIYKELPQQWPGRETWDTRCKGEKHIIKNVPGDETHLAVISYMAQYVKVLEDIYDETLTKAEKLYQSCSSNTTIREAFGYMYKEHLNWSDIISTDYNITLDVSTVETTDAKIMLKVIESFGKCLHKMKKKSQASKCAKRVFKKCGKGKKGQKKGGKKSRRQNKKRKGRKRSKSRQRN